jgi:AraC-like DNA-binding protein/quercetin dioxygenase-like cupin family protein
MQRGPVAARAAHVDAGLAERACATRTGPEEAAHYAAQLQAQNRPVVAMSAVYPSGSTSSRHFHRRGQIVLQTSGITSMVTERSTFVAPPGHILWIPSGIVHQSRCWGECAIQTIYVEPRCVMNWPKACRLMRASSLIIALMDEAVRMPIAYDEDGRDGQLIQLLLGEIIRMPEETLHVPMPQDARLLRICEAVLADTSSDLTLDDWANHAGLSRRTLTRVFRRETGQSFSAWRQRVRLLQALARLGNGEAVTNVALDVGYDSPSAFTAMFKRELGAAPRSYLRWADQETVLR